MWESKKLVWHGDEPNFLLEIEKTVWEDIESSLWGLDNPSDLIFHTVFLSSDMDGEHVIVWGEPEDIDNFHCQWYATGEIVPLNNIINE